MKQLCLALSLLFLVPGEIIANGRHCRRHCPRRMMCQPAPRPVVIPVQPPVVPVIEPVQHIAAQQVVNPVIAPEPELVITNPEVVLPTRTPLSRVEQLKNYMMYWPQALFAAVAGILGFGLIKRYNGRRVNPQPVPPMGPQVPPVAPVGQVVHLQQYPKGSVFLTQQPKGPRVQQLVPNSVKPVDPHQPDPVPAIIEVDVKSEKDAKTQVNEPRPQTPEQGPSQQEIDGKLAAQQGYKSPVPVDPASRPESVSPAPEIIIAVPDAPVPMPVPAEQPIAIEVAPVGPAVDVAPAVDRQPSPAPSASPSLGSEFDLKHGADAGQPVGVDRDRRRQLLTEGICSYERQSLAPSPSAEYDSKNSQAELLAAHSEIHGGPQSMKPHEYHRRQEEAE